MNLKEYEKIDTDVSREYIRFEQSGEQKILRFLYTSGGEDMGSDVEFRKKFWDEEQHKFIYDSDKGSLVAMLKCIEYDEDGKNPRLVLWERSAYFCKTVLLPMWKNFPRIIDGVWRVTASNPKTREATYSLFPLMDADTIKYPIIEEQKKPDNAAPAAAKPAQAEATPAQPAQKKKYWE